MDRELGFDLYTLKLLFLIAFAVMLCSCTVFASMGFYKILYQELLMDIPAWQGSILWSAFGYIGLYMGIWLFGRSGWSAMAETANRAAHGEPNVFAELESRDLPNVDRFGRF